MTSPRPYGGGYTSPSFADTPIYDRLVAERGTPQIAPIRVPAAYEPMGFPNAAPQPALPALPALPSGPSSPTYQQPGGYTGYQATPVRQQLPAPAPAAQAPGGYFPQQTAPARPQFPGGPGPGVPQPHVPQQMRPAAPRPAAPRPYPGAFQQPQPQPQHQERMPGQGPGGYQTQAAGQSPYLAPAQPQPQHQPQHQYPSPGYWSEPGAGH